MPFVMPQPRATETRRAAPLRLLTRATFESEGSSVDVVVGVVGDGSGRWELAAGLAASLGEGDGSLALPLRLALSDGTDVPDSTHTVQLNDSGDKLLIACHTSVLVVEIPADELLKALLDSPGRASGAPSVIYSGRCAVVGAGSLRAGAQVRRALWHPHAPEAIALLTDSSLLVFDVTASLASPAVSCSLRGALPPGGAAVSVAFGEPRSAMEALSAFVLIDSGAVFCLCPVVVPGTVLHKDQIAAMKADLEASGLPGEQVQETERWIDTIAAPAGASAEGGAGGGASMRAAAAASLGHHATVKGEEEGWVALWPRDDTRPREPRPQGPISTASIANGVLGVPGARATDIAVVPAHACAHTALLVAGLDRVGACPLLSAAFTLEPILPVDRLAGARGPAARAVPFLTAATTAPGTQQQQQQQQQQPAAPAASSTAWEVLPAFSRASAAVATGGGQATQTRGPCLAACPQPELAGQPRLVDRFPPPVVSVSQSGAGTGDHALLAWGGGAAVLPMPWLAALAAAADGRPPPAGVSLATPFGRAEDARTVARARTESEDAAAQPASSSSTSMVRFAPRAVVHGCVQGAASSSSSSSILAEVLVLAGAPAARGSTLLARASTVAIGGSALSALSASPAADEPAALSRAEQVLAQKLQELADARARDAAVLLPLSSRVMSVAADAMGVDEAEAEAALFEPPSVDEVLGSPQQQDPAADSVPAFVAAMDRAFHHFHRAVRGVTAVRATVGARMARLVAQVETLSARAAIVQAATEQDIADITGENAADDAGPSLLDLMDQCHETALEQCERAEELARRAAQQLTEVGPEERTIHKAVGDVGAEARTLAATVASIRAELDASIVRALRERLASPQASKTAGSMVARALRSRGGGAALGSADALRALRSPQAKRPGRSRLTAGARAAGPDGMSVVSGASAKRLSTSLAVSGAGGQAVTEGDARRASNHGIQMRARVRALWAQLQQLEAEADAQVERLALRGVPRDDGDTEASALADLMRSRLTLGAGTPRARSGMMSPAGRLPAFLSPQGRAAPGRVLFSVSQSPGGASEWAASGMRSGPGRPLGGNAGSASRGERGAGGAQSGPGAAAGSAAPEATAAAAGAAAAPAAASVTGEGGAAAGWDEASGGSNSPDSDADKTSFSPALGASRAPMASPAGTGFAAPTPFSHRFGVDAPAAARGPADAGSMASTPAGLAWGTPRVGASALFGATPGYPGGQQSSLHTGQLQATPFLPRNATPSAQSLVGRTPAGAAGNVAWGPVDETPDIGPSYSRDSEGSAVVGSVPRAEQASFTQFG
ncbi:hypothetical protein FNF27_04996 [Cafeteria roenbergensis]|uniref:Uncharacterized protein n=3 Tax=Cafeteria roenbergensis TaxID=33653 RepID=A0A5A8EC88_CAFRO|nr:hypothetical protein FNF27_04996 [Cafeteria roenbergensis]